MQVINVNDMKIILNLKNYCIHKAAKKYYERAISQYFATQSQWHRAHLEKEIDNLKYFLENADVGQLRSSYPLLNGQTRLSATLIITDHPDMWQIQFLDQMVDVIWKQ